MYNFLFNIIDVMEQRIEFYVQLAVICIEMDIESVLMSNEVDVFSIENEQYRPKNRSLRDTYP